MIAIFELKGQTVPSQKSKHPNLFDMKTGKKKSTRKEQEQFPGYPQYPADQDIMNRDQRVLLDDNATIEATESLEIHNGVSQDGVEEGLDKLAQQDPLNPEVDNKSDDLKDRIYPLDFEGKDLDVPGSELDDRSEATGNEDEENNLYSRSDG